MDVYSWAIVGITLVIVLAIIRTKKLLEFNAIATGTLCSVFVAWRGGLGSFFAIILFFLVGEFITRVIRDKHLPEKHRTRSTVNIVGNIGPAILALTIQPGPFNVLFFCSLAAAFADTLSSEIGVLSKVKPLLITTLKPVSGGTDGAVSVLGFFATILGGLLFGIYGFLLTGKIEWIAILLLAGLFGSILDSFLGATLQKEGYLDNNTTNFVAAAITGILFAFLF